MEVILKQDIKNLGYKDDIVKVRNGYGNNFLLPKGLAILASPNARKVHAENVKQRAHKIARLRNDAQGIADQISGVVLSIAMKAGENGKLFGSVTSQQLADKLKNLGYEIDKKQIVMPHDHIKNLGTYTAEALLHRDVKATINFEVISKDENN